MVAPDAAAEAMPAPAAVPGAHLACGNAHSQPIGSRATRVNRVIWTMVIAGLVAHGCATRPVTAPQPAPLPSPPAGADARVLVGVSGEGVVALPLEAYVEGAVAAEQAVGALPLELADAVLQVQAITARTYALANRGRHAREGYDLCDRSHCQLYRRAAGTGRARVERAVAVSRGRVLTYAGRPIQALYHSSCGGHTSAADAVWGGAPLPYLIARPDPFCATAPAAAWSLTVDEQDLRAALNRDPLTRVGSRLIAVTVLETDAGGRARLIVVDGELSPLVRGEEFRRVVTAAFGARSLRSLRFSLRRHGRTFVFEGRGFGHGVGLCQLGALERLRAGTPVVEVLGYYFPGAALTPLPAGTH
jgi:stage II sporulation protein D